MNTLNEHAQALGRLNRGKPRRNTPATIEALKKRAEAMRQRKAAKRAGENKGIYEAPQ